MGTATRYTPANEPMTGFEPVTYRLRGDCSTPELHWLINPDQPDQTEICLSVSFHWGIEPANIKYTDCSNCETAISTFFIPGQCLSLHIYLNRFMSLTIYIITITSVVSLLALYIDPRLMNWGMLMPYRAIRKKSWHELITSGFLHANLAHLFVNMFVLFFFGLELERALGTVNLLLLYLSGIAVSSIPTLIKFRDDPGYATIGASGAVGSVLFAYIFLFPTRELILVLLPIPMPAWVFAILYLVYSIYETKRRRGKINHEAHIAGALWGIIYMILFVPGSMERILSLLGLI
jgi:membrane associated rhomboid family serine protease